MLTRGAIGSGLRRGIDWPRLCQVALDVLARIGVKIHPFLVVRESILRHPPPADSMPHLSSGFIGASDIPSLKNLEPDTDTAKCAERLRCGLLCFAIKDGQRIVAKMWCDLEEFNFPPNHRFLTEREAYLFGAYVDPDYRRHDLAPRMRRECYDALAALGRESFLSYTDLFNPAARRFKQKLGAIDESLRLHVALSARLSHTFTLRRYTRLR